LLFHHQTFLGGRFFGRGKIIPADIRLSEKFEKLPSRVFIFGIFINAEAPVFRIIFMKNGISPRYTVWCPEPLTALGSNNFGAPLEYHVRLMEAWRETHEKYRLPVPPGYGEPGRGKAVFSVSAFMDILRNH